MNRKGRKLVVGRLPIVAMYLGGALLTSNVAMAQDVSQPESLSYDLYSSSSVELFWDRSPAVGMNYVIRRDGNLLGTTEGTSYLDRTLMRGQTYSYSIIAIDPSGARSLASSVSFSVEGDSDPDAKPGVPVMTQPEGLRADVYSSRSAELFWDRPVAEGLVYDILQNGALIQITDGVSFYVRDLSPGTEYVFQVVAVDRDGNRSFPSAVSFTTTGSSTVAEDPDVIDPSAGALVATPTGVQAAVYSSRSVELFWDRPDTLGLTYEVQRDGVVVASTDGISFLDRDLMPGGSYTFDIVAINGIGARSAASSIMVNTRGELVETETPPVITPPETTPPEIIPPEITPPEITPPVITPPSSPTTALAIQEPVGFFQSDGYDTIDVVRLDVRTETMPGICTDDDDSGCTLDDVKADIDGDDDFTVEIAIHVQGADLPDDGSISNADFRQRGGFSRLAPQKSFRIKLDSKEVLWRNERRLQLNKMPYDQSRIRNKLSFDLMRDIPHLPSLRTQFVNLWIDDGDGPEDYGLFTHTEYVGKEYLVNRERDTDDNAYKIEEFVFAPSDLEFLEVDEDGEPLDEDRFETRLGIKSGDDHSKVSEMIMALNDGSRTFDSVLAQYFDRDNVLAWVTVNFLLHQMDAVTHNFYLYNPVGTDKFYFMPWDYDGTFDVEQKPANNLEIDELVRRLYFGFSKGRASNFLNLFYRQPGVYAEIVARATELRNSYLSDATISGMASLYSSVVSEYASRMPDIANNFSYEESYTNGFAATVAQNYETLINYGIPFPPKWKEIEQLDDMITLEWRVADDMTGRTIQYEIEISSSPDFGADDQLLLLTGLSDTDASGYEIEAARIGTGTRYARLIARSSVNPTEFWQVASTRPVIDGEMRVGVMEFESR